MAERKTRGAAAKSAPKIQPVVKQAPARPDAVLQRRGKARVQAILDAAEEILAEAGYEAATLKAISERTGIPIASVYHYFADRHQVDAALIGQHVDALTERLDGAGEIDAVGSIPDAVAAVIDPMLEYFRAYASAPELWFSGRSETVAELVAQFDMAIADTVWRLAIERGLLVPETPFLVMRVAFESGGSLFDLAFKQNRKGDDAIIAEARRLVTAYLETYAPPG